jgi:hypothetical protein
MPVGKQSRKQVNAVRDKVFARDNHTCIVAETVWSGVYPCGGQLTIQHAVARGMGGSARYDGIDYLRTMCLLHNGLDTSNAIFHDVCLKLGWTVPRWLADTEGIRVIPVFYQDGWHLLQNGERIRISDKTAGTIHADLGLV